MGNPTIWYYPDPAGTVEEIDLVDISDLEVSTERFRTDAEKITGGIAVTDYGTRHIVRIVRARFAGSTTAGEDLRGQLQTLENHLQRGGSCAFAFDKDKAWAAFMKTGKERGTTVFVTHGNVFQNSAAAMASGDRVVIQSANPEGKIERARITDQSGDVVTLSTGLRNKMRLRPILMRERDFYPVLLMRSDAVNSPIVTTDQRMNYTLDLQLVEDVESLFKFAAYGGELTASAPTSGSRTRTVEQVIARLDQRETAAGSTTINRSGGTKLNR